MGLIKEPKNIDLTANSKPWTEEELAELRSIIKKRKKPKLKRIQRHLKLWKRSTGHNIAKENVQRVTVNDEILLLATKYIQEKVVGQTSFEIVSI